MDAFAKHLYIALRRASERSGVVILQAIAVVVVSAVITSTLVTVILLEIGNMQQDNIQATASDIADSGMGWAAAWAVHADLPLKLATDTEMRWTAPDATNQALTDCYDLALDSTQQTLDAKIAPYSGSGDCSTELSSATAQTVATGVTNFGGSEPVFTYYSGATSDTAPAAPATTAKSFDISLRIKPSSAAAQAYASSFHVIFGGAVTDNLLSSDAIDTSAFKDDSLSSSKFSSDSLSPADFGTGALRTYNRLTIAAGSKINYGGHSATQANVWRSSASSENDTLPSGATLAGGPSTVIAMPVDYRDYCVSGKVLKARAVYTLYNPGYPTSGAVNIGARLVEYPGPNPNLTPQNGDAAYTALPQSVPSDGTTQLYSGWVTIDDGSCSADNNYLSSSNPFFYTVQTEANVVTDYSVVNAAMEFSYDSVTADPGAEAPDTPVLLSPSDADFVGATPTLKARFTDPNTSDTGTLSFRICLDSACNTIVSQGSSAAGLAVGASGSWTVPVALSDGSTYYWQALATDSTTLQSGWSSPQTVKVATTPATLTITSLDPQTSPSYQYVTGTTLYFNPTGSSTGSFNINAVGSGGGWGIDYMEFPSLGANWSGGNGVVNPSNGQTVTRTYNWSAGAESASPVNVVMVAQSGLEKEAEFDVIKDDTAPSGGNLSYSGSYISTTSVDLTITRATDNANGAGMPDGGKIERRVAPFSSSACQTASWSAWNPLTTVAAGTGNVVYTDSGLSTGNCYEYRYIATDNVQNEQMVTPASTLKVGIPPSNTVAPIPSASQWQDLQTATVSNGTWAGSSTILYSFQWQRCPTSSPSSCADISGQNSSSYNIVQGDIGSYLRVQVTATNNFGQSSVYTAMSPQIQPAPPVNTIAPVVSGSLNKGATLSVNKGTWTGTPTITYTYRWQRCTTGNSSSCSDITGTNVATYQLQSSDVGDYIRAIVTATGPGGTVDGPSAIYGPVS
jgi:hypothetical protein